MKIIEFLPNSYSDKSLFSAFLQNLEPETYKRNKAAITAFLPRRKNKEQFLSLAKEKPFKDTTYSIVPSQEGLIIFDLDNVFTAEKIMQKLRLLSLDTLVTKSPYGAHIYFKYSEEQASKIKLLKSIMPNSRISDDKVEEALKSQNIKIEVFSPFYNKNKLIFDGANNKYYKIVSEVTEPCFISDSFIDYYNSLADSLASEASRVSLTREGEFIIFNKEKADFLYECLEEEDIDLFEFQSHYRSNQFSDKMSIEQGKSSRNSYLNSVWASFASCGYIKDPEDLNKFIHLVAEKVLEIPRGIKEKSSPYEDFYDELDHTVCRKGRFDESGYLTEEKALKEERKLAKKQKDIASPLSQNVFIGINMEETTTTNRFLLVDFRDLLNPLILIMCSTNQIEDYTRAYPQLKSLHYRLNTNKKGANLEFSDSTCPLIQVSAVPNDYENLIIEKMGYFIINTNFFVFNKKIPEILDKDKEALLSGELTKEQIIEDFKKTRWAQIVERNLLYDKRVRSHFYANIKDFLINKSYRSNMLIIKDAKGSTGKDSILSPCLEQMFFGDKVSFGFAKNSYISSTVENSRSVSAATVLKENFTDFLTSKLLIINEDGDDINNKALNYKLQSFLKNSTVTIREMYRGSRSVEVGSFYIRYTNSSKTIIDQSESNTRYYIAIARQDVTLEEWNSIHKGYEHLSSVSAGRAFAKEDEVAMLRYFLLLDHPGNPHVLPKDLPEEDTFIPDDIETITDITDVSQFRDSTAFVDAIFDLTFNRSTGSLKMEELERIRQLGPPPSNINQGNLPQLIMLVANTLRCRAKKIPLVVDSFQIENAIAIKSNKKIKEIRRDNLTLGVIASLFRGYDLTLGDKRRRWITNKLTNGGDGARASAKLLYLGD